MNIAIIKYNAGNIQSVLFALERIGLEATVTDDPGTIMAADKVIFPGVGEASTAMAYLEQRQLDRVIMSLRQPVLGICLGMQLLCEYSDENDTGCLGIIPVRIKKFEPQNQGSENYRLKVPQIGWNNIYNLRSDLFRQVPENSYVYHVHSYYAENNAYTIANCNYGTEYAAAIKKDNFYGVQFHTEKSARIGEQILINFLDIKK